MTKSAERAGGIGSYRDLRVWQTAMDLVVESYRLAKLLPADERFSLARQLTRAAISVPANIAEGHGRLLRGEYMHHLSIARGSLKELETLFALSERLGYLSGAELAASAELCDFVSRMLTRLRRSLRQTVTARRPPPAARRPPPASPQWPGPPRRAGLGVRAARPAPA